MAGNSMFGSMFNRRLALLGAGAMLAMLAPAIQLVRLTVSQGADLRAAAEKKLVSSEWLPTRRGRVLDRKGRELAIQRPSFDILIDYPVITGQWAFSQAARRARSLHKTDWKQLAPVQREEIVRSLVPAFQAELDAGWRALAEIAGLAPAELEERRSAIIDEVSRHAATVWERRRLAREAELSRGQELAIEVSISDIDTRPIREQVSPHVVLQGVDDRIAFAIRSALEFKDSPGREPPTSPRLPGLHVVDGSGRGYPFDQVDVQVDRSTFPGPLKSAQAALFHVQGVAVHLVGWMRNRLFAEDLARRTREASDGTIDRGFYAPGDSVGSWGVEASAEDELRGLRGQRIEQLDTGLVTEIPSQNGADVRLTIDANLQARIQALMSPEAGLAVVQPWHKSKTAPVGTALHAAAVVIDVDTGDILSMVSTPTFTREQLQDDPDSVFKDDVNLPLLNRAIARPYPPGSIVKPLMFSAAVTEGVFEPDRRIDCTGHLFPDQPNLFRCWIYKAPFNTTHTARFGHPLDVTEALMVSCNIYFYNVGRALGPGPIAHWYQRFGVGVGATRPQLNIGSQYPGAATIGVSVPESDDEEMLGTDLARSPVRTGVTPGRGVLSPSEAILMGIGQGPVAWTPLHAADAYATLARFGQRILPRLRLDAPMVTDDLGLNRRAVTLALAGLQRSVSEEDGTGHHITIESDGGVGRRENVFNVQGVTVWGKSGTADSGQKARTPEGLLIRDAQGQPISIDHSWFVVLAGPTAGERPRVAVALIVENGGSGGRVAGPLCNQILHALIAEGYL